METVGWWIQNVVIPLGGALVALAAYTVAHRLKRIDCSLQEIKKLFDDVRDRVTRLEVQVDTLQRQKPCLAEK